VPISEYAEMGAHLRDYKWVSRKVLSILLAHIYYSKVMENGEYV